MNTSNAKSFLTGSLIEQADYFDELEDIARFPETFPCSLISCALLEHGMHHDHDFEQNPMVYTSHKICIDRDKLSELRSNDPLHILVRPEYPDSIKSLSKEPKPHRYECYGLVNGGSILFRAKINLLPLAEIINRNESSPQQALRTTIEAW